MGEYLPYLSLLKIPRGVFQPNVSVEAVLLTNELFTFLVKVNISNSIISMEDADTQW